jgi:hypothetical protein
MEALAGTESALVVTVSVTLETPTVSHLVATGTFFLPGDSPPNPLVKV